jgi:hypothetical protein
VLARALAEGCVCGDNQWMREMHPLAGRDPGSPCELLRQDIDVRDCTC